MNKVSQPDRISSHGFALIKAQWLLIKFDRHFLQITQREPISLYFIVVVNLMRMRTS